MKSDVVFSAESDLWRTDKELMRWLHRTRRFDLDAAASDGTICPRYYGPGGEREDALADVWLGEHAFCNPPYSKVAEFLSHALASLQAGSLEAFTFLVGARTDTAWWQDSWSKLTSIEFLRGRCNFWLTASELHAINEARIERGKPLLSDKNTAPFPSAILTAARHSSGPWVKCVDWRAQLKAMDAGASW